MADQLSPQNSDWLNMWEFNDLISNAAPESGTSDTMPEPRSTPAARTTTSSNTEDFDVIKQLSSVHTMLTWIYDKQREIERRFKAIEEKVDSMAAQLEELCLRDSSVSSGSPSEYSDSAVDQAENEFTDDDSSDGDFGIEQYL